MRFTWKSPLATLFKFNSGKFNYQLEQDIRKKLDTLPSVTRIYTNPDGTPRVPTDEEFKTIAELQNLYYKRNYSEWNYILPRIPKEQLDLFKDNSQDLKNFQFVTKDSGRIIDKIPYKDENGDLKWKIVRETEKAEGWEFPLYYVVLPIFAYVAYSKYTAHMRKRELEGPEWAEKELRLRAMEDYFHGDTEKAKEFLSNTGKTTREIKDRDDLVVSRILAGDYDRLAQLKKKLPKDLLPREEVHENVRI
ncbi:Piso0_005327 [Millerozyma farinosa CBS 7064]|uniref:Piso0_005327 protein n=1 Tax=Pichia sorbitophila (strain ATCC MYA-4447 / BCRC 22081 / CBS 7064 / NBRC 10061 / NRRL Y-12695) TaxID=559304 RepID=G8Y4T8_PICSO|nr:Piso0_005327 [Millerozyma farinosa CBS 7064]